MSTGAPGAFVERRLRIRFVRAITACVLWYAVIGLMATLGIAWALAAILPHTNLTKAFDILPLTTSVTGPAVHIVEFSRAGMARREWFWQPTPMRTWGRLLSPALDKQEVSRAKRRRPHWVSWGQMSRVLRQQGPDGFGRAIEDARGWPFLALWCTLERTPNARRGRAEAVSGGFALPQSWGKGAGGTRALPHTPIWHGLALDIAFWGAASWAGVATLRATRTGVRRWRGRCFRCGYELRGTPLPCCPECGWRPRATEAEQDPVAARHHSANIASTKLSGSNGSISSGVSPTPMNFTGTLVSSLIAMTIPPLAVPSSLARKMPVRSTAF
jgi:hypothetical protein